MTITEIAVRRPVFTLVVYIAVTVFGVYALKQLPIDLYPEIENPVITVVTNYPGASSYDVEEKVTKPLEKALAIIPGIDEITSNSSEGVSAVYLKFDYGANLDEAMNDVRNSLDWAGQMLPDGLDDPMLFKLNTAFFPIYFLAITSDTLDVPKEADYLEDHVVQNLQGLPGVGSVQLFAVRPEEVRVEANLEELERRRLPLAQIGQALAAANVSVPSGTLEDPDYDLPVRVPAEYKTVEEIGDEIVGQSEGKPIFLRDVAQVLDTHRKFRQVARLNHKPISVLFVQKQAGANTVQVADAVKAELDAVKSRMRRDFNFVELFDASKFIRNMVGNLYSALLVGMALVVLVVFAFLVRFRASVIIAMAIPGSLIIAFLLMYLQGYTINAVSLMGMALAVGMVVDNSIVVLENVSRHLEQGKHAREASLIGTKEVGLAISASTLTTTGIFVPIIFVTGLIQVLFGQLAFVVVVTLLASLVTSLFLTPMLTSKMLGRKGAQKARRFQPFRRLESGYARVVGWSLRHKLVVVLVAILIFAGSAFSLRGLGFDFLPEFDSGDIVITAELPMGVSIERTGKVGEALTTEIRKIPEVIRVFYQAGEDEDGWSAVGGQTAATHILDMRVKLTSIETGRRGVRKVSEDIRKVLESTKGLVAFDITIGDGGPGQMFGKKPVMVEILGNDFTRLKEAAYEAEAILKAIPGTVNVSAEVPYEKPEVQIEFDRRRMSLLGVTAFEAANTLRASVQGLPVTRFRGGGEDVNVKLTLREEDKRSTDALGRVLVPSLLGMPVPIRNFAAVASGFSPIVIAHADQRRVLRVGSNLAPEADLNSVATAFDQRAEPLKVRYGDLTFRFGGQVREQRENAMMLGMVLILGILLTYLIMAAQFESFLDPFVIMFSVPFAFTGSFLMLAGVGHNFNVLAFLGIIMLVGIVVNNAIVLVDYINLLRSQGMPMVEAVVETGRRRLRPILMTTITTLFGMLPLALASGEGYELWQPIGLTVVGGLLVSSLVTLILIPTLYASLERFRKRWREPRHETETGLPVAPPAE